MRHRLLALFALALTLGAAGGCRSGPAATPAPAATPQPLIVRGRVPTLNPQGHVGLGVYLDGTPYDGFSGVYRFEQLVGHRMQYVLWFQSWGDSDSGFLTGQVQRAKAANLVPVITWEPWKRDFVHPTDIQPDYALASIAAGAHDDYIRTWARAAQATGATIILRFAHEQSTEPGTRPWYPWQGDPQGYIAAFRHIVDVFRQEGASNVRFLWSAMYLNAYADQYYPGADYVDLIATTILNQSNVPPFEWAHWRSFAEIFGPEYAAAEKWGKPLMITELGSAEQGGDKAAWLRDCFTSLRTDYPLVESVLLFEVTSDREFPAINWSVASSPESLAAFKEAVAGTWFR